MSNEIKCTEHSDCEFIKNNKDNDQQLQFSTFNYCAQDFERCAVFMVKTKSKVPQKHLDLHPQDMFNAMQILDEQ